jgi:DNA-binding SARP family transcriptional activator/tetratricopeptide (TPR) repeat protein
MSDAPVGFEFRLLGPLTVTRDGAAQSLGGPKQRALLAALLLTPNRRVPLARLVSLLWENPPRSAIANLRTYATGLRRLLGDRIVASDGAYQLATAPGESDVERFTGLVARGRAHAANAEPAEAWSCLEEALGLWRGTCGDDLTHDTPLSRHLRALDEEHLLVVEECLQARLDLGEDQPLVAVLRSQLSDHPTRERLWGQLMTALYRCGDVSGALTAYRDAVVALDQYLGVRPGRDLRELQQAILVRDQSLDAGTSHAAATPVAVERAELIAPRQLPMDGRVLIGRDTELAAVLAACAQGGRNGARPVVVALDGQGGIGKTALALRAAHQLAGEHPDGQLYVDLQGANAGLEPIPDAQALAAFLRALGDRQSAGSNASELAARFRTMTADSRLLLFLDNAVDAGQVGSLLPAGPRCTVLVTSRQRLVTLDASLRLSLGTLQEPAARAVLTAFTGDETARGDADIARVAELCGGLPLALRIAAARLASRTDWSVADLAERLADDHRRLDELGADDVSVRATFAGTYDALLRGDRAGEGCAAELFRLMGVLQVPSFSDGVLAALADLTAAEVEAVVRRLISLHVIEPRGGRYVLHDLLRLFAADLALRESSEHDRRSALRHVYSYYADATVQAARQLRYANTPNDLDLPRRAPRFSCASVEDARAWFDAEREALEAVVHRAVESAELFGGLATVIASALMADLDGDGRLAEAVAINGAFFRLARKLGDGVGQARAWKYLATVHQRTGDRAQARRCIQHSIELYRATGDTSGLATALNVLGLFNTHAGRYSEGEARFRQALELFESAGDEPGTGVVLNNIGMNLRWRGDHDAALEYLAASLTVRRRVGDRVGEIYTLLQTGSACAAAGRLDDALAHLDAAVRLAVELGARDLERQGLMHRLRVRIRLGLVAEAEADLSAALELCRITENPHGRAQVIAAAAAPEVDPEQAAALAGNPSG